MKEFYGTEEYFEQKVSSFLSKEGDEKKLSIIAARLEHEIRNDFICHERVRNECLENLFEVCDRVMAEK
ncbi:hypothetical protein [Cytobacillus firmus]|uniref:hypothetical protein n=1 Tax=Cytobacillus firmus TaxID=1399 RepID=UPI00202DE7DD|nr:hypothetical protein [Cytobacillus firmus]URT70612.1 hypothetical protein NAF01_22995 [Cytobacillus firmus]WHY61528.1 hypothetical protein QNH42_23675 [Cytobacillus firmus]